MILIKYLDQEVYMEKRIILRGDIYYADLEPVIGSEQGGYRPVLVIQNNTGNKHSPTVIVAAITGRVKLKIYLPTHYLIKSLNGLTMDSLVLLEQIRTIDKIRLQNQIGRLEPKDMRAIDKILIISLGIENV